MDLPFEVRRGIPASETGTFGRIVRRTTIVRAALAIGLVGALALVLWVAFRQDVRHAPLIPSGTTGILVLDLSASVYEGALDQTVEKLAKTDERTGLVVFSDGAYELLPPGSPARELFPLLRYFKAGPDGTLPPNPWEDFRAGTQISSGLATAHEALLRENVSRGSVVLVSDLEILPDQIPKIGRVIADMRRDNVQIRIVPLFPTPEKRALIEQLVGSDAFLAEPEEEATAVRAPEEERPLENAAPWAFVLAAALLVGVIALNERVLPRLEVRR
jgi:hypothetical protein